MTFEGLPVRETTVAHFYFCQGCMAHFCQWVADQEDGEYSPRAKKLINHWNIYQANPSKKNTKHWNVYYDGIQELIEDIEEDLEFEEVVLGEFAWSKIGKEYARNQRRLKS